MISSCSTRPSRLGIIGIEARESVSESEWVFELEGGVGLDAVVRDDGESECGEEVGLGREGVARGNVKRSFPSSETVIVGLMGRGVVERFSVMLDLADSNDAVRGLGSGGESDWLGSRSWESCCVEMWSERGFEGVKWAANLDANDGGETFKGGRVDGRGAWPDDDSPEEEIISTTCLIKWSAFSKPNC